MTGQDPEAKVFVSYAGDNRAVALQLGEALKGRGIEFFLDVHDIDFGDAWIQTLEQALDDCTAYIIGC
jgi:hypothetical protein